MRLVSKYAVETDVQNIWNLQAFTPVTEENSQLASLLQQPLYFLRDSASLPALGFLALPSVWEGGLLPLGGPAEDRRVLLQLPEERPRRTSCGTDTADPTCNPGGTNYT